MTTSVLFAESHLTIGEAARQVTARNDIRLEADIIVVQNGHQYVGVVPPRNLFEAVATLQENRQRYADPLTGLPGRVPLEQALHARLKAQSPLGVIRADLTSLAAVNQQGGLTGGDEAILELARLLRAVSRQHGTPDDFLTHLGGDDFVLLTGAEEAGTLCRALIEAYRQQRVLSTGVVADPAGQSHSAESLPPFGAPLCHLSVAALTNRRQRFFHSDSLMRSLYDLLIQAKAQPGSRFLIDPRP
jgi:GGDEF domain-containing protein